MYSRENTEWLLDLGSMGMRLGLDNITELLKRVGDPQNAFKSIHIAGTDGKGSTCAMLHSVLKTAGFRTGLYTSPHILLINERIRVDDRMISDEDMERLSGKVRAAAESMNQHGMECTFFEAMTAMALLYFKEMEIDYAVIETGLGGRFDATNVITPEVSVITHIGLEHTSVLGDTVEKIAFEKAGIVKPGVPVVTANGHPASDIIRSAAKERGSEMIYVDIEDITDVEISGTGTSMTYLGIRYDIGIPGTHQAENAAVAIEALRTLNDWNLIRDSVQKGLTEVRLQGRMERSGDFIIDVSHTPDGTERLAHDIINVYGKVILIVGMLGDKDVDGISKNLSDIATKVYVTRPGSDRAADPCTVKDAMSKYHDNISTSENVGSAMSKALSERKGGELILVTGSFHMAEDAKRWMRRTYAGS